MARRRLRCPRHRLGGSHLGRRVHRLGRHWSGRARLVIFGLLRPWHCLGVSYLARGVHRLDRRRRESGQLVVALRHRLSASYLACRARRLGHRRRESPRLVIFRILCSRHCFGVSHLARRVRRLERRRRDSGRPVVGCAALGIILVPLTSRPSRPSSRSPIGVRVLCSSSLDFFTLDVALVSLITAVACFVSIAVGMRVLGSSSAVLPSVSPWFSSPRPSRASSPSPYA